MTTNSQSIDIIEAANMLREILPCKMKENEDFLQGGKRIMEEYLKTIKSIDDSRFDDMIQQCKLNVDNLTKARFYNFVSLVADAAIGIIETYLDGNPYEAYDQLNNLFSHSKVRKKKPASGYKYLTKYLDDSFVNLFSHDTTFWKTVYRIRIGEDIDSNNMYHVPFDLREKVGPYRFSIPGWPAFYVGTSVDVCWSEVKRESKKDENVYVARFTTQKNLPLFNLQIPPVFGSINDMAKARYLYYFLATFPILALSLVKVRNTNEPFKPEYIMPQMILQYVKTNSFYEGKGILYSSTKCDPSSERFNLNIVIPTEKESDGKYSKYITDNFTIENFKMIRASDIILDKLRDFQKK